MKKRLWELGKSLLIVLLICSMLLLTVAALPVDMIRSTPWLSTLLQPLAPILGLPEAELTYVSDAQTVQSAAQPLSISIRNSTGRYTAQWDFFALDSAYETLGGLLGQALDTAAAFTETSANQLPQVLSNTSVCFDYGFTLPAQLLASWLDAPAAETLPSGSRYILAVEEGQVNLYLSGDSCYYAATQINPEELTALLEQYPDDGSAFAFEADDHLSPLTLLPGGAPTIAAAVQSSPCDNRYIETLATALGFNPYDETRYTDSTNVTYFSESNCSLQVGTDGHILLSSSAPERFQSAGSTLEARVEQARSMVALAAGEACGDARLYLSGVTINGSETLCTFDYILDGIPIIYSSGSAVTVTFSGNAVTRMELLAATFSLSSEQLKILPPAQAAAILPNGGQLILQYHCTSASKELTVGWVK